MKRIMVVFGTRPEAIKMAPVVLELQRHPEFEVIVTVTAQHREMLDQVLQLFDIRPDYDLNIMSAGQTLSQITSRVLMGMDGILEESKPDIVLVHGDTTTTFAATLAAYYHQIPVGHVEAGLRTWNKYSPYPEEINRRLTSAIGDLHFAPTELARANLLAEGVCADSVFVTGNTVIDALLSVVEPGYEFEDSDLRNIDFEKDKVILLTCHRRENLGAPMAEIFRAVREIALAHHDVQVIFPMHRNPAVREAAREAFTGFSRVHMIEPLEYKAFSNLMSRVYLILTDSGGIQEEAPSLGKPVLVLRDTTERPEAVTAGTVLLTGTSGDAIKAETERLLRDHDAYEKFHNAANPYGDGQAARKIAKLLSGMQFRRHP